MTVDIPEWQAPALTKYDLDYADLTEIDLSTFDQPGGKEALAKKLSKALQNDGFWAVVGHGIPQKKVDRQFALAKHFFSQPLDEKSKKSVQFDIGDYFGYKPLGGRTVFGTDVLDNVEIFNMAKFTKDGLYKDVHKQQFIHDHYNEVSTFSREAFEVARKLFVLFAIILELDENYFADKHAYDDPSDDHLRYMSYKPRSVEEDAKVENTWSRGHTDFGSLTLLWNQVVCGLQIKVSDGSWKYVRPVDGGIICNVGDTLSFWSGGFFKSTIHRVQRPPPDQVHSPRVGLFYFVRPGQTDLEVAPSPLLKRLGLYKKVEVIKGHDYVRSRVKNYHDSSDYGKKAGEKFKVGDFEIDDGFE